MNVWMPNPWVSTILLPDQWYMLGAAKTNFVIQCTESMYVTSTFSLYGVARLKPKDTPLFYKTNHQQIVGLPLTL